jgi:prenylcysteine oxidase/farnesylcysteine lyase
MCSKNRITLEEVSALHDPLDACLIFRQHFPGSTVVYPYENKSLTPFELGASIFVRANKNLIRAAKVFEFELLNIDSTEGSDFGIYDGQQFVAIGINDGGYWKYWDNLKLWWRYGYPSPATTNTLCAFFCYIREVLRTRSDGIEYSVSKAVQSIDKLYQPGKPYKSIEDISDALNFTHLTAVTAAELLDLQGVSKTFSRELVEAATRVNYAQVSHPLVISVQSSTINMRPTEYRSNSWSGRIG